MWFANSTKFVVADLTIHLGNFEKCFGHIGPVGGYGRLLPDHRHIGAAPLGTQPCGGDCPGIFLLIGSLNFTKSYT